MGNGPVEKDSASRGIDPDLRDRVRDEIPTLEDALEAAVADPTDENLDQLREAADKLMRALGRVLIEIARQRSASLNLQVLGDLPRDIIDFTLRHADSGASRPSVPE
jgi:hypothetical protein